MVTEGSAPPASQDLVVSLRPAGPGTALPEQPDRGHDRTGAPVAAAPAVPADAAVPPVPPRQGPPARTDEATRTVDLTDPAEPTGTTEPTTLVVEDAGRPRHRTADLAAELFRRWTAGDAGASRELVALLTPTLWHTARAYRLDAATAEDVVQNAWLALARRQDQLRDPQAVLAWLMVTVRRDAARTAASSRAAVADPEPVLAVTPDSAPGPASTVLDADQARRLWAAVARLPERCQRLLRVVAFSDRPDYASLSAALGMPVGSIGPTRGRCLKKLRDDLDGQGGWTT